MDLISSALCLIKAMAYNIYSLAVLKNVAISIENVPIVTPLNRILDNSARKEYDPIIKMLFESAPETMSRKIPEANVQQAFVFDTVRKFASQIKYPKILCVGSYHDTASEGLKKAGYRIKEIDPAINYDLNKFSHKFFTKKNSYDIIFSTSVIEHVENDELFIIQIAVLLRPGGFAVLTCDFNDTYVKGKPLPQSDFRFYTRRDFIERLLPLIPNCSLVDEPKWECLNPDFTYDGCDYSFATLVFRKDLL